MRFWGNLLNFVKIFLPYNYYFPYGKNITLEQEAHGPHRSPEKTVQINKQAYIIPLIKRLVEIGSVVLKKNFLISSMHFRYFIIISPWKRAGPFIWTKLNPLHSRMHCDKFGWNWPSGSGEELFYILLMYFLYFVIISPLKRSGSFIWTNLNPLHPRMLCAKFGWNWLSGFG